MPPDATVRSVGKQGRPVGENEDSAAVSKTTSRFAIADGASTSARPELWSEILVEAFAHEGLDPLAPNVLSVLRQRWWKAANLPALPWFAQAKLAEGSAASFIGLTLTSTGFYLRALGDSCLLHIRDGEIILTCPLQHPKEFSRFPKLVTTREDDALSDSVWEGGGQYEQGDLFVLASDALAKYLLHAYHRDGHLPPIVAGVDSDDRFIDFVNYHRNLGMDNDDTTICVVRT